MCWYHEREERGNDGGVGDRISWGQTFALKLSVAGETDTVGVVEGKVELGWTGEAAETAIVIPVGEGVVAFGDTAGRLARKYLIAWATRADPAGSDADPDVGHFQFRDFPKKIPADDKLRESGQDHSEGLEAVGKLKSPDSIDKIVSCDKVFR